MRPDVGLPGSTIDQTRQAKNAIIMRTATLCDATIDSQGGFICNSAPQAKTPRVRLLVELIQSLIKKRRTAFAAEALDYTRRLEQPIARMKKTDATLVWASTTPIPDNPAKKQAAASIVEPIRAAADLMEKHGVAINDLFTAISPRLAEMQNPNDVHFNASGYDFLGRQVAAAIDAALKTSPKDKAGP